MILSTYRTVPIRGVEAGMSLELLDSVEVGCEVEDEEKSFGSRSGGVEKSWDKFSSASEDIVDIIEEKNKKKVHLDLAEKPQKSQEALLEQNQKDQEEPSGRPRNFSLMK